MLFNYKVQILLFQLFSDNKQFRQSELYLPQVYYILNIYLLFAINLLCFQNAIELYV